MTTCAYTRKYPERETGGIFTRRQPSSVLFFFFRSMGTAWTVVGFCGFPFGAGYRRGGGRKQICVYANQEVVRDVVRDVVRHIRRFVVRVLFNSVLLVVLLLLTC